MWDPTSIRGPPQETTSSTTRWKPTQYCVGSPDDGGGYGHEERAKEVCNLLCRYIHFLRFYSAGPVLPFDDRVVRLVRDARWPTEPPSPCPIFFTVDGAIVNIGGRPHLWIFVEAYDFDHGGRYFCCWRNRQTVFPLHEVDGTLRPAWTWKDISNKLLFQPLHNRCHASPCELGWGPKELQIVRDTVGVFPK